MGQKSSKAPQVDARYLAPQKLYCYSEVDLRKLRRLIKDRKLAPCFPGVDSECCEMEDCPICFLKFPSLNRAVCCHKPICTECFLQVKSLQAGHCPKCPYCKADFSIYFHGPTSTEQKIRFQAEEQQQNLAARRSQQEERRRSQQRLEQRLPAVPRCPDPYEHGRQANISNQTKVSQQAHAALQQYEDFLPSDLSALAAAFHYDIDLNEVMFMQGICASLQPPDQHSSIPADHGSHQTASIPIPTQTASDSRSTQQRSRSSPGMGLSQAESIQARTYKLSGAGEGSTPTASQVDRLVAGAGSQGVMCDSLPVVASNTACALQEGSSACQSDGSVQISVRKAPQSGRILSDVSPSASSCGLCHASSSLQHTQATSLDQQSAPTRVSADHLCSGSKPQADLGCSSLQSGGYKSACGRGRSGTGDSLAGFLQDQARAGQMGQAFRPQPASGTHELTVGMVLTDSTFVPNASSYVKGRDSIASSSVSWTSAKTQAVSPDLEMFQSAASSLQAADEAGADLTGGAVKLQNPDGSVQYVVLTSDEQKAVQLSLQAQRRKQEKATDTSYQVACTPEDNAVQEAIAQGDAILQRLYCANQNNLQQTAASSVPSDVIERDSCENQTDPLLKRMEDADARLRALYSTA